MGTERRSHGETQNEKSSGGKQKAVIAFRELLRFARFYTTFPTKHTINKSKIAGILNIEHHMRLYFEQ